MSKVSTYLNFPGNTEAVFQFYKTVFKTDFLGPIHRFSECPGDPNHPMPESARNMVMHVALPILGGHVLMGTDSPEFMGPLTNGNNVHINLQPDTRAEADRLFNELSKGGKVEMPMQDMFWGAYYGSFADQFGIQWMINCESKE